MSKIKSGNLKCLWIPVLTVLWVLELRQTLVLQMSKLVACQMGIVIIIVVSFVACSLMIFQGISELAFVGFLGIFLFLPRLPRIIFIPWGGTMLPHASLNRFEDPLEKLALILFYLILVLKAVHYFCFS